MDNWINVQQSLVWMDSWIDSFMGEWMDVQMDMNMYTHSSPVTYSEGCPYEALAPLLQVQCSH